jgi:hypothetical protein
VFEFEVGIEGFVGLVVFPGEQVEFLVDSLDGIFLGARLDDVEPLSRAIGQDGEERFGFEGWHWGLAFIGSWTGVGVDPREYGSRA